MQSGGGAVPQALDAAPLDRVSARVSNAAPGLPDQYSPHCLLRVALIGRSARLGRPWHPAAELPRCRSSSHAAGATCPAGESRSSRASQSAPPPSDGGATGRGGEKPLRYAVPTPQGLPSTKAPPPPTSAHRSPGLSNRRLHQFGPLR
ncbi:hypothetical protein NDU88_004633 [Pleurodeles waltl]|uniref:Uncharacterized protein n=1 Tax=Pleurodeles waltl TaxID=8319 RepID=A0AAV7QG47_PLEWA|nr:hypothetical protein NDU88_004633 [Pleurodeles waltl]